MASTSSGQTSTQTVQPLSAMHLSASTMTGTLMRWLAKGMANSPLGVGRFLDDAQPLVGGLLLVVERQDVRFDRAREALHAAVRGFLQMAVHEPIGVVALRVIHAIVVQAPAALGAKQRGMRGHVGAVVDMMDFH